MNDEHITPESMTRGEREDIARRHVHSAESWLRTLIHHQLSRKWGAQYLTNGHVKKSLRESVQTLLTAHPGKFTREIDATTFEQAIEIVCNTNFWALHFETALRSAYPFGPEEARTFLSRIKDIRNDVSHGRGCSARQVEQAICYSNDLAEAIKNFFKVINMQRIYDVPMIVKYSDNLGNDSNLDGITTDINGRIIDWRRRGNGDLYPGNNLVAEIEVDPSYGDDQYRVRWYLSVSGAGRQLGKIAHVLVSNQHVGEQLELSFEVISTRDWHRQHGLDDRLCLVFRVLPPV